MPSNSTKDADSSYSPLGHIGHFDPVNADRSKSSRFRPDSVPHLNVR
jgi:hypothetical protein